MSASFPPTVTPLRAWLVVALLMATACLNYLDRLMVTTMRGSVMEAIPMTEAQFGLLTTVFLLVYAVCSPFAGYFADRFSRSRVIIGSVFVWSVVTGLTAYARTYEELLLTRALMGISEAACMPASVALIVDYHRGSTRSLASGLLLAGAMIGAALGGLGGWMAEGHGWAYAFKVFGVVGAAFAVLLAFYLRDAPATPAAPEVKIPSAPSVGLVEAFVSLFTHRPYLLMLLYACLLGVVSWSVVGWMPTYIKEQFNLSQGNAGLSTTLYLNLAALLGMLIGGAWADRWSRTQPQARILVPVIGLLVAAPAVLLTANASLLPLALAGLVGYGLARNFADANMMPILCLIVDPRYRATSWGVSTFFSCTIGGAGIYVGGMLRDAKVDISRVFQFAAINLILCAGLLLLIGRASRRTGADGPTT
ncbi:MAG: MFS transporter [Opitutaceae bacterium]|nr:MFS transporter [Opitutaceae bacterium]